MGFEELYLVSTRVDPLDGPTVDALLAECAIDPPGGYREFMTRFGLGEVCGFLSLRAPDEVRRWQREVGPFLLDEGLYEVADQQWAAQGVTCEQFCKGVSLWSTNQRPSFLAVPGHGPRVFEWDVGEVVCHERGMIDLIPAVARLMGNMSFPYFEPRCPGRKRDMFDSRSELEVELFVSAVIERWGEGVRRLHSEQDDYLLNIFVRPIQARLACWREEEQSPGRVAHIGVTYDAEHEGELHDFLHAFVIDVNG